MSNLLIGLIAVLGGIIGYYIASFSKVEGIVPYLLPFAAGGFIYIATSDLMPELRKEEGLRKSVISFGMFLSGILIMILLKYFQ